MKSFVKKQKIIGFFVILLFYSQVIFAIDYQKLDNSINEMLKHYLKTSNIPGVVLSIQYPGEKIRTYVAGYSDIHSKKLMGAYQLFPMASITKSFVSAIILRLQSRGKLHIDDTLLQVAKKHSRLAKVLGKYPYLKQITIRQLLTHRSGLPRYVDSPLFQAALKNYPLVCLSRERLLNYAMKLKPNFKPGEKNKYNYTDTEYLLAGLVIESISGHSVQYEMSKIFRHLGRKDVYFPNQCQRLPSFVQRRIPSGYMLVKTKWSRQFMQIVHSFPQIQSLWNRKVWLYNVTSLDLAQISSDPASGGIITTVPGMVRWYANLFSNKIINKKAKENMLRTYNTGLGYRYGLGITVRYFKDIRQTVISHTGTLFGYSANVLYLKPSHIIIGIATNSANNLVDANNSFMKELFKIIFKFKPGKV